ncbi:MAG: glycosyltransferase family 9 protein [Betaproteobacteria bacterium]|nr:glycosyltransferase family 9 protein [Betaproteobacteria bacterium]
MDRQASPRLLVIRRDNIGDLVCTTPLLRALRRQLPQARIECLVTRYNQAVLGGNPDIDALHAYTKAKHREAGETLPGIYGRRIATILDLRRRRFDRVLLPGGGHSSALRFARWVAPQEVLVRDDRDRVAGPHEVEQCCHLLVRMGLDYEAPPPRVMPGEAEAAAMRARLARNRTPWPRRLIALHISARKPSQRWPAERFAALARRLAAEDAGTAFLLLWAPGGQDDPLHPGDDEKAQAVLAAAGNLPVQPVPTLRLEELIAALSLADLVVCGDGGAMHLAAGLGKPIVALFGQSDAARWRPWAVPQRVLQAPSRTVEDIPVGDVFEAVRSLMEEAVQTTASDAGPDGAAAGAPEEGRS